MESQTARSAPNSRDTSSPRLRIRADDCGRPCSRLRELTRIREVPRNRTVPHAVPKSCNKSLLQRQLSARSNFPAERLQLAIAS